MHNKPELLLTSQRVIFHDGTTPDQFWLLSSKIKDIKPVKLVGFLSIFMLLVSLISGINAISHLSVN